MFLLDNNAHKLYIQGDQNMVRRVQQHRDFVWLSSVPAEELLQGYMSVINHARSSRNSLSLPQAHIAFAKALEDILDFPIFVSSEEAEAIYRTFSPATIRVGAQDCRIAAQALTHGMTVITRDVDDFKAIGAPCQDWSSAA